MLYLEHLEFINLLWWSHCAPLCSQSWEPLVWILRKCWWLPALFLLPRLVLEFQPSIPNYSRKISTWMTHKCLSINTSKVEVWIFTSKHATSLSSPSLQTAITSLLLLRLKILELSLIYLTPLGPKVQSFSIPCWFHLHSISSSSPLPSPALRTPGSGYYQLFLGLSLQHPDHTPTSSLHSLTNAFST